MCWVRFHKYQPHFDALLADTSAEALAAILAAILTEQPELGPTMYTHTAAHYDSVSALNVALLLCYFFVHSHALCLLSSDQRALELPVQWFPAHGISCSGRSNIPAKSTTS